jgi:hypothetical protein
MKKKDELKTELQNQLHTKYNSYLVNEKLYLNERRIFEHYYEREFKECSSNPNFSRFFNEHLYKPMSLDLLQKYDVVKSELQNANAKWDKFEKRKDELTDDLLAKNQEIIQNIKDIKMEVYDLNRKIDIQSDNPKSGKINADVFDKFFDEKFKKCENLKTKLSEQNNNLINQIKKEKEKLDNKDNSQELKFIDFYQLQIENKKYMKEVDEKNKMLLKLKMTIGKISQDKNRYKNDLDHKILSLNKTKVDTVKSVHEYEKIEDMIQTQENKENEIAGKTKDLGTKHNQLRNMIDIEVHVNEKNIENELYKIYNTLNKKLEIEKINKISKNTKKIINKTNNSNRLFGSGTGVGY